jgi:predicted acetyltransferase
MHPAARIELQIAKAADRACIEMLMQFYHYDASEWISLDVTDSGRFSFRPIDRFWNEPGQFPFLIRADGVIAGFAVVDKDVINPKADFNVGYLFVLRRFRGTGVGRAAARELFTWLHGQWEVYQVDQNHAAIRFWRRVIADFTQGEYVERAIRIDDQNCIQQQFRS